MPDITEIIKDEWARAHGEARAFDFRAALKAEGVLLVGVEDLRLVYSELRGAGTAPDKGRLGRVREALRLVIEIIDWGAATPDLARKRGS